MNDNQVMQLRELIGRLTPEGTKRALGIVLDEMSKDEAMEALREWAESEGLTGEEL